MDGLDERLPLATAVNGLVQERETGFEPATSSLGSTPRNHCLSPNFPKNIAILPLGTAIANHRKRLQFFSGNSGIFKMTMRAKR